MDKASRRDVLMGSLATAAAQVITAHEDEGITRYVRHEKDRPFLTASFPAKPLNTSAAICSATIRGLARSGC